MSPVDMWPQAKPKNPSNDPVNCGQDVGSSSVLVLIMVSVGLESDDFESIDRHGASLGPNDLAQIQKWLQPTDYSAESSEFRRHLASQAPGTGYWICETPRFQQWHNSEDHGSLWIKGVPGAGKSVIAASMVEHLSGADEIPVLFFFFRYIIAANRNSRSLIRDWTAQLLPYSSRLQVILKPLSSNDIESVPDEQLWEHLLAGLSSVEKVYCIVDALDEMELDNSDAFLQRLNSFAAFRPKSVKLLMTSRPKEYLQSSLRDASIVHISLESNLVERDIGVFVSHRLRSVLTDTDQMGLRDSLASTISTRSRGLFLYARLLLDQILPRLASVQPSDIKKLARTLPVGLEDMYNSMMFQQSQFLQIPDLSKLGTAIQVFLLECVTHSSKPPRLNELANVLDTVFIPSISGLNPASLPNWNSKQVTRTACAPLLEILEDGTIQVIHHSFTEFLLDVERVKSARGAYPQFPVLEPSTVHKTLATTCLEYLQSGCLRSGKVEPKFVQICDAECDHGDWPCLRAPIEADPYNYQRARLRYPFLQYAVTNWTWHTSHYDVEDNDFFSSVSDFLNSNNPDFQRWLILQWGAKYPVTDAQIPSALHVAAFAGMTKYASSLIFQGQKVDSLDANERTPLHWAATRGHTKIVTLLLRNGANPDPADLQGIKPLHMAARNNHANIVRILLHAGVDPSTPKTQENHRGRIKGGEKSTKGETAVKYACELGQTESIVAMLPFLKPETLEEVLCSCCRFGKSEATRAVLENSNVSPNARFEGATALYLATVAASANCVEMLLAKGADPNLTSEWEPMLFRRAVWRRKEEPRTPLHKLAELWNSSNTAYQSIFRLLMKAGADLEAKARCGETPLLLLFSARGGSGASSCYLPAIKSFLEAGSNISAVGEVVNYQGFDTSRSVLQRLLEGSKNLDVLDLLLDHGADIHVQDKRGNNALHMALGWPMAQKPGTVDGLVNRLLGKGVQANIKNNAGLTPLEMAVQNTDCSLRTFTKLLQSCLDSEARKRCLSLVERRTKEEKIEFIQELLSAGVSLDSRDSSGATPLLKSTRSSDLFQILLDYGAKLNAEDNHGRGVLHHYVQGGHSVERLQSLVELGLDPKKVDKNGNTLLHIAIGAYCGTETSVRTIQQLLDFGISPNSKNNLGFTPGHIYFKHHQILSSTNKRSRVPLLGLLQKIEDFDINAQDNEGWTLLHLAVFCSEIEVAQILAAGADSNILNKEGRSALHLACRARKSNIVGLLISKLGQELIDKADLSQRTALHDACTSGRHESVYDLLRAGASVNFKDSNGRTPLHACAESTLERSLSLLRDSRNNFYGQGPPDQCRPVTDLMEEPWYSQKRCTQPTFTEHDTVRIGSIVSTLIAAGADVNALDRSGRTPLDLSLMLECHEMTAALRFSHPKIQKSLQLEEMDLRLQIELALKQKPSVIGQNSSDPVMKEVLENPSKYLSRLTSSDIDRIVSYHENNSTMPFYDEAPLLQIAAKYGLTEIVERLGTRVSYYDSAPPLKPPEKDDTMMKPYSFPISTKKSQDIVPILQTACERAFPNLRMLEVLIEKCGVDVNARSRKAPDPHSSYGSEKVDIESPALHCLASAEYFWQLDGIQFLVQNGADVDAKNEKGETALHIASTSPTQDNMGNMHGFWKPSCVKVLLELGANPNAISNDGLAPLHRAASSAEIMRSLLQFGANLSVGKTSPIFFAIMKQNFEALRVILGAGGDPNAVAEPFSISPGITDQTRTALFCASFATSLNRQTSESVPLIKLLIESGADVNATLNDRETLIHYVFEHAEYDTVQAFLDCHDKVNFNTKDQLGRNVLLAACDWTGVAPGYRHKHWFAKEPCPLIRLLGYGVDLLAVSEDGRNVLHHLMDNPDFEQDMILELLDREPEACTLLMQKKDKQGFNPFHSALRVLRPEVCFKLMAMGANLLDSDPSGATALHHIARQYLQVHRPSQKRFVYENYSKEHYEKCLKLWKKYFDLGGSINVCDNSGSPPLFSYLSSPPRDSGGDPKEYCCHVDNFTKLFDVEELDINIKNNEGESALHIIAGRAKTHYTKESHERQLFKFFLKRLDPLSEDKSARTALDVAAATGKTDILELFKRS